MSEMADLTRMREEYSERQHRFGRSGRYSIFNPAYLFMLQSRERAVLALLKKHAFTELPNYRIIEIGCGSGGVLQEFLSWGANPACLYGIDLLLNRLQAAHRVLPHLQYACCNGEFLPYTSGTFNIVLQYTAFSSILDDNIKQHMAAEMVRVLHPGGMILWYDFWTNPTNKQTRGIRAAEIRHLFPGGRYDLHKITLAPPIARRLVPVSWGFARLLEGFRFLNGHYLVAIHPISS